MSGDAPESLADAVGQLGLSDRLRRRRFVMLPVDADAAAPTTEAQGRQPGDATTPADLAELISSIARVGLLQPILVEDIAGRHRVVAGERRLRALRWGRTHLPDNPHFAEAPAVVCPGPLSEDERRVWQLVENLAREDLQPAELGAALMLERSAVLAERLEAAGHTVPEEVWRAEDPVRRWTVLDRFRRDVGAHSLGAPWDEVLARVGVQLSVDKARQVVRAFSALPREVSTEMDAEGVALATRLEYLRLDRGRSAAAAAIWAAVRDRGKPKLLSSAIRAAIDNPDISASDAVAAAEDVQAAANDARRAAHTATAEIEIGDDDFVVDDPTPAAAAATVDPAPPADAGGVDELDAVAGLELVDDLDLGLDEPTLDLAQESTIDQTIVAGCVDALETLLTELRSGGNVTGYAAGTLRLHARELTELLKP